MANSAAQGNAAAVIRTQLSRYIGEWRRGGPYDFAVGVRDLSFLERHAARSGGRVAPLEGKRGTCIVVADSAGADLWVRTAPSIYGDYRDAFIDFAGRHLGAALNGDLGAWDVDHLFNSARAKAYGLSYVRVGLVDAAANRSWGRTFETRIGRREPLRHKDVYLGTPIIFAKILGLPAPRSNLHVTAVIEQIIAALTQAKAIDRHEVGDIRAGATALFMRAYRDSGKTFGEMNEEDYFGG